MKFTQIKILFILLSLCLVINSLHLTQNDQSISKNLGNKSLFLKNSYNYFVTEGGNQVWAGALSLAWHQLTDNIIKQNIQVDSSNDIVQKIVNNFNQCLFKKQALNQNDYYIKSGYGQNTLTQINTQVKAKFPEKSFPDIDINLQDKDIISYGYLFKKFEYPTQFKKLQDFQFKNKTVNGFTASTDEHRKQLKYHYYENQNQFMFKVQTKNQKQGVYYIKTQQKQPLVEKIINQVQKWQKNPLNQFTKNDYFSMPVIDLDYFRQLKQIEDVKLKNKDFQNYKFSRVYEALKLKVDQTGVKVENQGVIVVAVTSVQFPVQEKKRYFHLNDTFWILLKQEVKHPYLVIKINQPSQNIKM